MGIASPSTARGADDAADAPTRCADVVRPVYGEIDLRRVPVLAREVPCVLRAPQSVPRLGRSLSHSEEARARAEAVAPQTKPGDTILMNFFIDRNGYTTLQYMKNVNGTMVVYGIEGPDDILTIPWTFVVTDFGF